MKAFSLKLDDGDLALLAARAAAAGEKPATHARRLLLAALKSGATPAAPTPPAGGPAAPAPADGLRRAVWCLLVALSPDLDEDRARAFVEAYFDAPAAPGYAHPGRTKP